MERDGTAPLIARVQAIFFEVAQPVDGDDRIAAIAENLASTAGETPRYVCRPAPELVAADSEHTLLDAHALLRGGSLEGEHQPTPSQVPFGRTTAIAVAAASDRDRKTAEDLPSPTPRHRVR
jgi:hypothetical protein